MLGKIIAFAGIHSSGKTAGVLEMVSELKKRSINAWFVVDVARTVRLPLNEKGNWLTQEVIAHRMAVQLLEAASKHDVVITDRTLLDCLAYNLAAGTPEDSEEHQRIKRFIYDFTNTYNPVVFQLMTGLGVHADGVRSLNEDFYQKSLDFFNKIYNEAEEDLPNLQVIRLARFQELEVRQAVLTDILKVLEV